MLSSAAKGREVMRRKGRSQFPHGHLVFFIIIASQQLNHSSGNNSWGSYGCANKHFASVPEHPLCIKEAKVRGDVGQREVHSLVAYTCG